jgi:hypothetical protein
MRIVLGILLALAVAAGAAGVATYSYHAGVVQGLAQHGAAPAPGPYPGYPYYGYGYPFHGPFGLGFGFFGPLWIVLLIFLVFALARRLYWGGRRWGGPRGGGVPPWFDEWHRRAHESRGSTGGA